MNTMMRNQVKPVRLQTKAGALANVFPTAKPKKDVAANNSAKRGVPAGTVNHKAQPHKVGRR